MAHVPTPTDMLSQPFLGDPPFARAKLPCFYPSLCLWIITASHAEAPRHTGTEEKAFFFLYVKWTVCVHTELQMNCSG